MGGTDVATYQIDLEKQHLAPEGGHNYAWSNCYLVNAASLSQAGDIRDALAEIEAAIMPVDTQIRFTTVRSGIGGPIPGDVPVLGRFGDLAAPDGYVPMHNTARIIGLGAGRVIWYKRWRGPLRVGDVSGVLLTGDYQALLMSSYIAPLLSSIPLVTRSGERIRAMHVIPTIAMWQRRDGTTRRLRSVLAG